MGIAAWLRYARSSPWQVPRYSDTPLLRYSRIAPPGLVLFIKSMKSTPSFVLLAAPPCRSFPLSLIVNKLLKFCNTSIFGPSTIPKNHQLTLVLLLFLSLIFLVILSPTSLNWWPLSPSYCLNSAFFPLQSNLPLLFFAFSSLQTKPLMHIWTEKLTFLPLFLYISSAFVEFLQLPWYYFYTMKKHFPIQSIPGCQVKLIVICR